MEPDGANPRQALADDGGPPEAEQQQEPEDEDQDADMVMHFEQTYQDEIEDLLLLVDEACNPRVDPLDKRDALANMSLRLRPGRLSDAARASFVRGAMERGVVASAVGLIEGGGSDLATAASNFLGDFAFNSHVAAYAVLAQFDRLAERFRRVFRELASEHLELLEAAVLLCVNIAATCPSGHSRLIPLVQPVCEQILKDPRVTDNLRGNTILLLANLSTTVTQELRLLRVADVLLELIFDERSAAPSKSVAESVVIFLHGEQKSPEVDRLMADNVVGRYCVPIMQKTLSGDEFRGMYPHLLYSARLFSTLSRSREYAAALSADKRAIQLLLEASKYQDGPLRVESDLEGRRLALEALGSLAKLGLWTPPLPAGPAPLAGGLRAPREGGDADEQARHEQAASDRRRRRRWQEQVADDDGAWQKQVADDGARFVVGELPRLLADECADVRAAAAGVWACLHPREVARALLVGHRLEERGFLAVLWRERVMTFLFPAIRPGGAQT